MICCSQNIGRLSFFHQGGIRQRSLLLQAKVQPRGLLLRFDTCEHVHTINPCAGQRLSLLQESEDLRGWHSVSVPQQLGLSGAAGLGAMPMSECMHVLCYNSEHCTLFEFMCDWCVFTHSVHVSIV